MQAPSVLKPPSKHHVHTTTTTATTFEPFLEDVCATCGRLSDAPEQLQRADRSRPLHTRLRLASPWRACSGCKALVYCSAECQKQGWKRGHQKSCGEPLPTPESVPALAPKKVSAVLREFGPAHAPIAMACAARCEESTAAELLEAGP